MSDVGVATSPGYLMQSPPTTNLVRFLSFFSGRMLHTNEPYVTSFLRLLGTFFPDELDRFGRFLDAVTHPVCESSKFICRQYTPIPFVFLLLHDLPVVEELTFFLVHYCQRLVNFILQKGDFLRPSQYFSFALS